MRSKTLTCIALTLLATTPVHAQDASDMFGDLLGDTTSDLVGNIEQEVEMQNVEGFTEDPMNAAKDNMGAAQSMLNQGTQPSGMEYSTSKSTSSSPSTSESTAEHDTSNMSKTDKKILSRIKQYKSQKKSTNYGVDTESIVHVWPQPER